MKSISLYFSILLSIFIFSACEKEIEFNGQITDPMIVVNSYLNPDSLVSAQISVSRFFLKDSTNFRNIPNAEVAVWVNGAFKEKMSYDEKGIYNGTFKPSIGDTLKLVVNVPGFKEVTSQTVIDIKPIILSIDTTNVWTGTHYDISTYGSSTNGGSTIWVNDTMGVVTGHTINYTLRFKDNGNEKNYYRLIVKTTSYYVQTDTVTQVQTESEMESYFFEFTDVVSGDNANTDPLSLVGGGSNYNEYRVFSDELFNGKTYPLTFSTNEDVHTYRPDYQYGSKTPDRKKISIYLQSISKDYYLYAKSRLAALNGDNFFSEQVQIHNNIVGGIGILGSYTASDVYQIDLQ